MGRHVSRGVRRTIVAPKGLQPGTLSGHPTVMRSAKRITVFHRHGCIQCGQRYDDACTASEVNDRCHVCRGVRPGLTLWERSYAPAVCCRTLSRAANEVDVEVYKLGGPGPWWICQPGIGCARTFPYDPRFTPAKGTP
jgi:hypothetical protein